MFFDPSDVDHRLEFFSELLSCQNHFYRWTYDPDGFSIDGCPHNPKKW
jgi:hypothetical protein